MGGGYHSLCLDLTLYHDSAFAIGKDCYINGKLSAIASERRNILIGNECLISFGVWMRTADPHLVYDLDSGRRINPSEDVLIGDHVWIGQSVHILKKTYIGSGSIVGAAALVAGKTIPSNTSWGGNPAHQLKDNIGWDRACVNSYHTADTDIMEFRDPRQYDYSTSSHNGSIQMKSLSQDLHRLVSAQKKRDYLKSSFYAEGDKNRFSISEERLSDRPSSVASEAMPRFWMKVLKGIKR